MGENGTSETNTGSQKSRTVPSAAMKPSSSSSSAPASSWTASKLGSAADDFTLVGHSELKAFVADANEAVNFKPLRKYCEKGEEDKPACTKEEPFNPEMSHQV